MPFFRPILEHGRSVSTKVSVSIAKAPSQNRHQLRVRIGDAACKALHVGKGDRIEALWGAGADAGKILIQRAQSAQGACLRPCGGANSATMEVALGNMPRLPIASEDRKRWSLKIAVQKAVRLDWEPYPRNGPVQGLMVTLPASWWQIEDGAGAFRAYAGGRAA